MATVRKARLGEAVEKAKTYLCVLKGLGFDTASMSRCSVKSLILGGPVGWGSLQEMFPEGLPKNDLR